MLSHPPTPVACALCIAPKLFPKKLFFFSAGLTFFSLVSWIVWAQFVNVKHMVLPQFLCSILLHGTHAGIGSPKPGHEASKADTHQTKYQQIKRMLIFVMDAMHLLPINKE